MRACYACASTPLGFRVTKFDSDLNVEATYVIANSQTDSSWTCSCPQGHKPSCKHRLLVNTFIAEGRLNTHWMQDADTKQWVQPVRDQFLDLLAEYELKAQPRPEPRLAPGEYHPKTEPIRRRPWL